MFPFETASAERLWLIVLMLAWAALLFGGFIFGKENAAHTHRMPMWTRIASSFALVLLAWSWWIVAQDSTYECLAFFTATGMTLGFVGDLFMAELIPFGDRVLGGIAAFGLGHLAYIIDMVGFADATGHDDPAIRWIALAVWLIIAIVAWYLVIYRTGKRTFLHLAALPYALLLASTAGFATGLALQTRWFVPVALGAALFLVSDLILAAQLFNSLHFHLIGDVIWLTYGPGQMLIVCGVALQMLF